VIDRESYKKVVGGFFQSGVRMGFREFFIDTSFIWYRGGSQGDWDMQWGVAIC